MITLGLIAAYLAAQAGTSTTVLWIAGIAAFIGFILGSVPAEGENRGWRFDMPGAVLWAVAAALIAGGLASGFTSGVWIPALLAVGFGALLAGVRIINTLPARVPRNSDLAAGVHRVEGDSTKAKFRAAKRLFYNASFREGNHYATRGLKEFWYGSGGGMPGYDLEALASGVAYSQSDTFAILVLLVNRLPEQEHEPSVVVVRGTHQLRQVKIGADFIEVPGVGRIHAGWVAGMVGYAWR